MIVTVLPLILLLIQGTYSEVKHGEATGGSEAHASANIHAGVEGQANPQSNVQAKARQYEESESLLATLIKGLVKIFGVEKQSGSEAQAAASGEAQTTASGKAQAAASGKAHVRSKRSRVRSRANAETQIEAPGSDDYMDNYHAEHPVSANAEQDTDNPAKPQSKRLLGGGILGSLLG